MAQFAPSKQNRHSIRVKGYDYTRAGAYFVTSCVKNREHVFGEIHNGEMPLSKLGEVVKHCWTEIPQRFPNVELDAFVVMPNHIHGIIILTDTVGAGLAPALFGATARVAPTENVHPKLGDIVGAFKSLCVMNWLNYIKQHHLDLRGKFWQRNYYEHIVRDEKDLNRIREYIVINPTRWELDRENPHCVSANDSWSVDEKRWFTKSNLRR